MSLRKHATQGSMSARSLLNRLIDLPDLASTIQALPAPAFAALVRKVGVEDAGEIVALATTEQIVQAFDEDLFVSDRAGDRETLDGGRFVVWLEILLETGEDAAADRVAELDEDFVAHALSTILLVLDEDALRERLADADEDETRQVDKALESALTEDLDGYVLVAKQHEGWNAALALVLALDRNHRALLVRLLDRLARVGSRYLDDLEELTTVLSEGESLAEDVEAAREERRNKQGHVEAQAARAFLALARKPQGHDGEFSGRDALTHAYFRGLDRRPQPAPRSAERAALPTLPSALQEEVEALSGEHLGLTVSGTHSRPSSMRAFMDALQELNETDPRLFLERLEEFAYLMNVLLAAHERDGARLRLKAAADAVLATVTFGAIVHLRSTLPKTKVERSASASDLVVLLRKRSVDLLFRAGSGALAHGAAPKVLSAKASGLLYSAEELEAALA